MTLELLLIVHICVCVYLCLYMTKKEPEQSLHSHNRGRVVGHQQEGYLTWSCWKRMRNDGERKSIKE